jgi:hypothetical protein
MQQLLANLFLPHSPVLHRWCNKHSLTNLFLPHSSVMQQPSPLTSSFPHATVMQHLFRNIFSLEILVCCIADATKIRSLTSSFHIPPWCNIFPASKPSASALHRWCNNYSLASLFLLHATDATSLQPRNPRVLHRWCNKHPLLIFSFRMAPWCNISRFETMVCCIQDGTDPRR